MIDGQETDAVSGEWMERLSPVHGESIALIPVSESPDMAVAVSAARKAWRPWADLGPVARGLLLRRIAERLDIRGDEIVAAVCSETGKSIADARGELSAAIEFSYFMASEGRRLYGRTIPSAVTGKHVSTERSPVGVAGLIVAANTPLPNYTWKAMPALLCGNAVVLKPSEHTPLSAQAFADAVADADLPPGVFNLVHGRGEQAGRALVTHKGVDLVSFTGGTLVGREVAKEAGSRLAKVCLELGGRNPFVVCDDADLDNAADAAVASAFSNAGQRCAAGSRLIVDDAVYDDFMAHFLGRTAALVVGAEQGADLGPVVSMQSLERLERLIDQAVASGARVLTGGGRFRDSRRRGSFLAPTVLEVPEAQEDPIPDELFGPVVTVQRVRGFEAALSTARDSDYGLTAAIHTADMTRARAFVDAAHAGMVSVNGPTYGSEPHMPFGGFGLSGNGFREGGTEVLDFYSEWKSVATWTRPFL